MFFRGRKILSALLVLSFVSFAFHAHLTYADEPIVKQVELTGNKRTPSETLREKMVTRREGRFSVEEVDRDIKTLYKLGQFQDITAETEPVAGGVKVIFAFVEKPLISKISFSGNRKIKGDDLQENVTQRTYAVLDEEALAESMEKIRGAYAKKGFYLVEIDYHINTLNDEEAELVFDIKENKGVAVRRVLFIGNKVFDDDELREVIRTKQKAAFSFLTGSGKFDEELLKQDAMMLAYNYLNHGYLKVKVLPAKSSISKDKRYIYVTFQIHEGEQYRIGEVAVGGDVLTTKEELMSMLKTKHGNIYSQKTLDGDLMALTDRYGDEGYAYANIVPQTIPDDETLTADININISKGQKITVEKINIIGNTTTRDKVIRRELEIKENDRYSERLMRKSKENLMRLGFFEEVNFATPRGSRDDTMELNITVKEKPTRSFNVGAGFSSAEMFIFNASVSIQNFLGYGLATSVSAELSKIRQLFELSVQDPYFLDTNWMAGFSVYRSSYRYTDFKREATGGDVSLGHRFFDNFAASVGYQVEQVDVGSFSFAVPQIFKENSSGLTSALSLTVSRDTRNNELYPTKGLYDSVVQEVSGAKLGGNNDFYRVNFRSMFYQPIWKSIVFRNFIRVGYIKSLNDKPVPLFERFFTGGVNSLRGYDPNSVGPRLKIPRTPDGREEYFVYGGDKLLLLITEIECPIYDKAGLRAVAFFDAGNAFAEDENYSFKNLRLDYGFGLRWNSPMGPLRFEFGIPIQRQTGEAPMVFNFTIGNFF
jgi:outer membrane protein insertion porin family